MRPYPEPKRSGDGRYLCPPCAEGRGYGAKGNGGEAIDKAEEVEERVAQVWAAQAGDLVFVGRVAPPLRRVKGTHETSHKPPLRFDWWRSLWASLDPSPLRRGFAGSKADDDA